ncbi:MAG: 50S ribosomal protein L29 [Chloroflexi bacterium]|nr:50S ribosomal protein L29 [Chloroflexota bacterium]
MKIKEVRELPPHEVRAKLKESYEELFKLRFQLATKQLANYQRLTEVRRTIARLKTILRERELQSTQEGE